MKSKVDLDAVRIYSKFFDVNCCTKNGTRAVIDIIKKMEDASVQQDEENEDETHLSPEFHGGQYLDEPARHRSNMKNDSEYLQSMFSERCNSKFGKKTAILHC